MASPWPEIVWYVYIPLILLLIISSDNWSILGFASETAGFILECAEDENDDVVKEALKLKNSVEAGVGHIDGL